MLNMELKKKKLRKLTPPDGMFTITDRLQENQLKNIQEERKEKKLNCDWKLNILNFSETDKYLSDFIFIQNRKKDVLVDSLLESNQTDFNSTIYNDSGSVYEFFEKYHKINDYLHKEKLSRITPSFNFIKGIKTNLIVPNPAGLVKRKGKLESIELK